MQGEARCCSGVGWVDPSDVPVPQPGLLLDHYSPGDIGFDPIGLKPSDPEEYNIMVTKELQNGRLPMLAASWPRSLRMARECLSTFSPTKFASIYRTGPSNYHRRCLGHSRPSGSIFFHFCHTSPPTASNRVNTFSTLWHSFSGPIPILLVVYEC